MDAKQIANKTIEYLGGYGKIMAMVNGKDFAYDQNGGIQFKFSGNKEMNIVKFELTQQDLYKVTFYKYNRRTLEVKVVKEYDGIYADQLKSLFERVTGLDLSLQK